MDNKETKAQEEINLISSDFFKTEYFEEKSYEFETFKSNLKKK